MNCSDDSTLDGELRGALARQQGAFSRDRYPSAAQRQQRIDRLIELVLSEADALVDAMSQDFGSRSPFQSYLVDGPGITVIMKDNRDRIPSWMLPERRSSGFLGLFGARARIEWQPLGVVGVIAPWNFPVSAAVLPACQALAAGNRVMVKLPEQTPRTSALLRSAIAARFAPEELHAVVGDASTGAAFSRLPFDHLLFTGSTAIGRQVLRAAAENLVPVTLELGGKCPVVIANEANLARAAERIAVGKVLNAGQICLAPDYVLVPAQHEQALAELLTRALARMLPSLRDNPDYTAIINDRQLTRLESYLDDARALGAVLTVVNPGAESLAGTRKLAPTLLQRTTPQMEIRKHEIFGPLLPLIPYRTAQEAIDHVNAGARPLAAYYFGPDDAERQRFLRHTHSGGVTLNDIMQHAANDNLPFGGVGHSGMGRYHGADGFRTLSHGRAIQQAPLVSVNFPFVPPYGPRSQKLMQFLRGRALTGVRKRLRAASADTGPQS